jgi:hypothetical protein
MKRRTFLEGMAVSVAAVNTPALGSLISSAAQPSAAPSWLEAEPLVVVSAYGHPMFQRRNGRHPLWGDAIYQKVQSEEAVRKLKDIGVTMSIIPFFLGFGLEAEKEEIADSRKLATLLRQHGIRVGVYVGSTIMYETFLLEKPEAKDWLVPDYLGQPVVYYNQTFRRRVYFMHPGYREYIKRVLRVAVEDLQVDMIHFDNTSDQARAPIFFHPLAIKDFRQFLQSRYSTEQLSRRWGISDVSFVEPPRYVDPQSTIDDPCAQDWTEFRCQQLARYYAEMRQFIRSLNPNVATAANPHRAISGFNTIWEQGVDYPSLAPQLDVVWSEEEDWAGTTSDGIFVSAIRSYKMATALNKRLLTYTAATAAGDGTFAESGVPGGRVSLAESMVYNRRCLGNVGGGLAGYDLPDEERNYIKFFHDQFALYQGVETMADVALLYSHASMGFNNDRPWVSFMLFAQTLIQARVPFDLVFDEHLTDLSKYRVLALADQECLSDLQLDLIRKFVNAGGGLVATEHTSLYTEWRQRRSDFGLRDLWGVAAPAWLGSLVPETVLNIAPVRRQIGTGRVVYIAEVKPALEKPSTVPMSSRYWKLPKNWEELRESVRWAAGGQLTLEVEAPPTVTAELLRQPETGMLTLHLINYDLDRTPKVEGIHVRLRGPKEVKTLSILSPDQKALTTAFTIRDGVLAFTFPNLEAYSVAVIR